MVAICLIRCLNRSLPPTQVTHTSSSARLLEELVEFRILGCNVVYRLGRQYMHDQECYQRHQEFLECDVEKLRCAIFEKVSTIISIGTND